ncbi:MAG: MBL fold metallo-hydrolase [Alphaproteobacteria bacterium]|nr:MBL fold metallo-hydrolase [Alphaproteobacteria bacterium]
MKRVVQGLAVLGALGAAGIVGSVAWNGTTAARADEPVCSAWAAESSRFMGVPFGAFMPDRAYVPGSTSPNHNINTIDLPDNFGIIKCGNEVILADSGWKQTEYHKQTGTQHFTPIKDELADLGIDPSQVTKIVVGHAHWDHAGQLDDFPNATVYIQREELRGIEWALNYPNPKIAAVNQSPGGCFRSPACGYEPLTMEQVYGKVLHGKAQIVDGEMEIAPGVKIHPAFRAHTNGSQLLEVPTSIGKVVFGSDVYSSWEGIRDWMPANIQQTDTVQQMLAYEKCYKITGGYNNCFSAHEPLSYSDKYPLLSKSWTGSHGERLAEIALAPGEKSRHP